MSASGLRARLARRVTQAIGEYDLLAAGDHVLVAVSGGKDSYTLLSHRPGRTGHARRPRGDATCAPQRAAVGSVGSRGAPRGIADRFGPRRRPPPPLKPTYWRRYVGTDSPDEVLRAVASTAGGLNRCTSWAVRRMMLA
ncbi:MAG: hypothetical protein V3V08_15410 [Nannocystaceae bacterium]